jgi:hypothetical protein
VERGVPSRKSNVLIDVEQLADELSVSAAAVRKAAAEITGSLSDHSSLSADVADRVRDRLRSAKRGYAGSGGGLFSAPAVQYTASRPARPDVAPAFASNGVLQRPRQGAPAPLGQAADNNPSAASAEQYSEALTQQLSEQAIKDARAEKWRAAGLGPHDGHIIEQCERHGLTPEDLRVRVDGQTMASRLKNGESVSSVRSRLS